MTGAKTLRYLGNYYYYYYFENRAPMFVFHNYSIEYKQLSLTGIYSLKSFRLFSNQANTNLFTVKIKYPNQTVSPLRDQCLI